ncbi:MULTISPECIES: S41 family peptidase [Heyndrickxia]|uniref:S41 family peptidase n=1 Tax=Heyndrickxia coagulans TaxID=1398 RepID=A0AAW7CQA9_HEYCO|nr:MULTISPECIES: S41 family peptidase [Heyndrickxia]AVD55972.1 peptidase S41 [Heyndrickxia coagulans]MDL5040615.1 S41 family peptidase [Heyndrickxia coagulans]MEC2304611.1 S41 family peptidase [Weizmannia sp. CD-2023]MEC2339726.1 S41 family peptidase [Weizmannia sp. CD-2023]MED4920585.1 S41 family peptidase [Weizmannia sp. CD-2023]
MENGMKVVKPLDDEKKQTESGQEEQTGYIRMKKFKFVMLLFFVIFITAGITTAAFAFGDQKAVNVTTVNRPEFDKLYKAYDSIQKKYYTKVKQKTLVDGAINGMVESLNDPYSDYMSKTEASDFNNTISSSFEGIGAEVEEKDGYIVIVSPIKGSPAEKAGLKPNDKILAVDGKSVHGMSANEAVMLIRGKKGTKVTLTIQHVGSKDETKVTLTRDTIPVNTVYAKMLKNGVAHIQITTFSDGTYKEFKAAVENMKKQGMKSMIVDVRQDPGGLLDQAIKIANMFVPEGRTILQTEDRNGSREKYVAESGTKITVPAVVMLDGGSASASEILAAALNESAGIPLVGEKSYGKGTVQSAEKFNDGSILKFTVQKWLTPNGSWIHKKGIEPDEKVSLPDYAKLPVIGTDAELKLYSVSEDVKTAEKMLKALGYNPGRVDGYFDWNTKTAVEAFQMHEKMQPTGIINGDTATKLMSEISNLITRHDTQLKKAEEVVQKEK